MFSLMFLACLLRKSRPLLINLPDSAFTASLSHNVTSLPYRVRTTSRTGGYVGGWLGDPELENQWIQVDLGSAIFIHAVEVHAVDKTDIYVTEYQLACSVDSVYFAKFLNFVYGKTATFTAGPRGGGGTFVSSLRETLKQSRY